MTTDTIEVMASAGSFESLMAAIKGGCNSVYFGIEQLNMRAKSSVNFTIDDLREIANICSEHGVKSYITLNTILYDHDMQLMRSIVDAAKEAGITAVIASDHAAMAYARQIGFPVHISTQANVTNIETVAFYAVFADVMVLSRELSLSQVKHITREIKKRNITGPSGKLVRIEVFAHGALCMAVSGKCYLSLHSHNSSANRGACIQNCRHKYIVTDKEDGYELEIDNEYIMSAKDLCTIDFLDKMIDAGIEILKIEGRGRSADYVFTTTNCYKEARNAVLDGTFSQEKVADWKEQLATVFNRGFWDGYYLGRKMGEWSDTYGSKATRKKVFLGKGVRYFSKAGAAEFLIETGTLRKGDHILITGPTTGIVETTVDEIRAEDKSVEEIGKGISFSIPLNEKIRPSDKLYKLISN